MNILLLLISYGENYGDISFVSMVQTPNNPLNATHFYKSAEVFLYFTSNFLNVVKIKVYIYVNIGRMDIVITSIIGY